MSRCAAAVVLGAVMFALDASAQLSWVQNTGTRPNNAVFGGREANGEPIPIGRMEYRGGLHPGKVVAGQCHTGWGGKEVFTSDFEYLVANGGVITWVRPQGERLPAGAFVAGSENGENRYIGRVNYRRGVHSGKVLTSAGDLICNFSWGGNEIVERVNFEVLVYEAPQRAVPRRNNKQRDDAPAGVVSPTPADNNTPPATTAPIVPRGTTGIATVATTVSSLSVQQPPMPVTYKGNILPRGDSHYSTDARPQWYNSEWMSHLPDDLLLSQISLPGTHQSGSFDGGDIARNQTMSIAEQLKAGIRYFDFRVKVRGMSERDARTSSSKLEIWHGIERNELFDTAEKAVNEFLNAHPSEAVVFYVQRETRGPAGEYNPLIDDEFEHYAKRSGWITNSSMIPRLGDVRGKVFVITNENSAISSFSKDKHRKDEHSKVVSSPHQPVNTMFGMDEHWDRQKRDIARAREAPASEWHFIGLSASSGGVYPYTLARYTNRKLLDDLGGMTKGRLGTITMDFPGPSLIDAIIRSNQFHESAHDIVMPHYATKTNVNVWAKVKESYASGNMAMGLVPNHAIEFLPTSAYVGPQLAVHPGLPGRPMAFIQTQNRNVHLLGFSHDGEIKQDHGTRYRYFYETVCWVDVGNKRYLFQHDADTNYVVIDEVLPDGSLGHTTDSATWQNYYQSVTSVNIGGRCFLFMQGVHGKHYVQEILPGGKLGPTTDEGGWQKFYPRVAAFKLGGKAYLFGQNADRYAFIQEIRPDGTLGATTDDATWNTFYDDVSPIIAGDRVFLFLHDRQSKDFFIDEILPGGKFGPTRDSGRWNNFYATGAFRIVGSTNASYLCGISRDRWFVHRINPDGTLGTEYVNKTWPDATFLP